MVVVESGPERGEAKKGERIRSARWAERVMRDAGGPMWRVIIGDLR